MASNDPHNEPDSDLTQELADKVELLEGILNDSNQLVQMSYLEDLSMVYVNGTARAWRGGDDAGDNYRGQRCHKFMMGLDEQCPFCPLRNQNGEKTCSTEVDNGQQVFSVKTVLVEWKGRPAFIEYAADVTTSRRAQQGFENQMRTLLQSIPEAQGIMHFDLTEDRCLTVEGAATNNLKSVQTNVTVDTAVAQVFSFIPDKAKQEEMLAVFCRQALIDAYNRGAVELSRETKSYFDDGSVRWARVTARVIQNPANDHLECILYGTDISDEMGRRHALEDRVHHHLALFNALAKDYLNVYLIHPQTDTVHVLKLNGFVTSGLTSTAGVDFDEEAASSGEGMGPYPYQATYLRYIAERVHPDDVDYMREAMSIESINAALASFPEYVGSYRVLDENGETHFYQFKYLLAENDEGILAGFQNIDALIAAEHEQQGLLKNALAAAEEANVAKSVFLSNMSHDIRTPLNAIIGFNQLAMQHLDDPQALERYLKKTGIASEHLLSLVNDVLDMSHIESGQVSLDEKPFRLPAMFDELHTIIAGNAHAAGVELEFDTLGVRHPDVVGDEVKLKKILVNILGNAVKFTPRGGNVWFSVEERDLHTSDYAHFLFRIRDNGIGMSREFQSHVFEAFTQERPSTKGAAEGTGLGLSIVKSLVNMMEGSIHLESAVGEGSEFTVSLHLKVATGQAADELKDLHAGDGAAAEKPDFRGRRILLVEDNEFNREIAFEILRQAGFEVDTAEDGDVAVEKVALAPAGAYDVVLMDIQMPTMNGYDATRAIRRLPNEGQAGVPIIAVTANAFSTDRDEALAAGMDGHISKPIEVDLLIEKMRELIK